MSRKRRLHWPPLSAPWQSRRRAPHAWAAMGWGRVVPAPPAPINTVRVQKKEGGAKRKKREERTAANGERNRKREKPTERERGTTETEKPKKPGISTRKPRETVGEKEEKG